MRRSVVVEVNDGLTYVDLLGRIDLCLLGYFHTYGRSMLKIKQDMLIKIELTLNFKKDVVKNNEVMLKNKILELKIKIFMLAV